MLTQRPLERHVGRRLFVAVGVFGLAAIAFGLSDLYWLSFAALLVLGAADMVSVYVRGTLVPLATPDAPARPCRRRRIGLHRRLERARPPSSPAAARRCSARSAAVLVGGSLTLAVTFAWARLFPPLRRVDRFTDLT